MGCTQAKSMKSKSQYEGIVAEIIQVIDELDEIKEKYIFNKNLSAKHIDYQVMSIEEFLLTSYKTNRFSKDELQMIYHIINETFKRIDNLLRRVRIILEKKGIHQIKLEVEEFFNDFLNIFTNMTQRILEMPAINFDNYQHYEVSKCITNIDSQSILM
ncbi:hypothetical protein ABPG72_020285 [Tetrahymena utriculariae]